MFNSRRSMFDYPHKNKSDVPQPPQIKLQIGNGKPRTIDLSDFGWLLVGRTTEDDSGDGLGLDLTPYGGLEKGVSRNHAAFSYVDGCIYIEDLDSTSGTRLNGLPLIPNQRYRLRHNDELEFGNIRAIVRMH